MRLKDFCDVWSDGCGDLFRVEHTVWKEGNPIGTRVYYEGVSDGVPEELMGVGINDVMLTLASIDVPAGSFGLAVCIEIPNDDAIKEVVPHNYVKCK